MHRPGGRGRSFARKAILELAKRRTAEPLHGNFVALLPGSRVTRPKRGERQHSARRNEPRVTCIWIERLISLQASGLTQSSPGLFLLRSRPWLLTTAARGGLESAPVSRFREADSRPLSSYALPALTGLPRSWRTIACNPPRTGSGETIWRV